MVTNVLYAREDYENFCDNIFKRLEKEESIMFQKDCIENVIRL